MEVMLIGDILNKILQFPNPLLTLFKEEGIEAWIILSNVLTAGVFFFDTKGKVIAYCTPSTMKGPLPT